MAIRNVVPGRRAAWAHRVLGAPAGAGSRPRCVGHTTFGGKNRRLCSLYTKPGEFEWA
ncbi:hypothetical protein GCM10027174_28690 [Salinifilum aidingensis]